MRADKRGETPQELAPILERLQMSGESWLSLVHEFRRKFRRAAGTPASLLQEAQKRGCRKRHGVRHSRAIFDQPPLIELFSQQGLAGQLMIQLGAFDGAQCHPLPAR